MRWARSPLLLSVALCCGTTPCGEPELPGESVGTFEVVGTLEENSCGQGGVAASDPLRFAVEIRDDRGQAVWRRPGWPMVVGSMGPDGAYRFATQHHAIVIEADPATQFPGCMVAQLETVRVRVVEDPARVDAGAPSEAGVGSAPGADAAAMGARDAGPALRLEGSNLVELVPTAESDCRPAVASGGGPFLALPCRVAYTLGGTTRSAL